MRYATVCSGIEAPSVAWDGFGWSPVFFSEIEPFPCAVLEHHYPGVPNLGDMTKIDGTAWLGKVDVLCAGTPCQAFSVAGLRNGLSDHRGNLTLTFVELANAIDPAVVLWENVPGVLSDRSNAFGCFLAGLVGADAPLVPPGEWGWVDAGVAAGPRRNVAWRVLDAKFVGLAQRRRRVYVVGLRAGSRTHPAAILLEPSGVRRDPAPRREAREGSAVSVIKGAAIGRKPTAGPQYGEHLTDGSCYTLNCTEVHAVAVDTQQVAAVLRAQNTVRRLTPRECERLQGFPDDYTLVPFKGKPAADSHRYRALGNSMPTNVIRWIGERIGRSVGPCQGRTA